MTKKYLSLLTIIMILLSSIPSNALESNEMNFNEFGFKTLELQKDMERELDQFSQLRLASHWKDFGVAYDIPLEKKWTIKLSREFNYSEIAAVSIVSGNEFIPVNITQGKSDELMIYPKEKFAGSTNYSLRIVLNNGNKYKKNFTTTNEYRDADIEDNNSYKKSSEIYLNEKIIGNLESKNDNVDFYKIEIPRSGTLRLDGTQLDGGEIGITLYNEYGTDSSYIDSDYNGKRVQIVEGLEKGTYYIAVYRRSGEGEYTLENRFIESKYDNDNSSTNYINSKEISINGTTTGHIGHYRSNGMRNTTDLYKIRIPDTGKLKIDGTQLDGGEIGITLYNEYGTDSSYIDSDYNGKRVQVIEGLEKGTYYIGLYNRQGYGAYELDLSFIGQNTPNDNSSNNYINAEEISTNATITGHIGHFRSNGLRNASDFYKIELPKDGQFKIDGTQLDSGEIGITLYNEYGTDNNYIDKDYNGKKVQIIKDLKKGTYYIGLYNRQGYGAYELNLNLR